MLFAFLVIIVIMKNVKSLKLNKDFRRLYARGAHKADKHIVVYALKNKQGLNRLGLTASKSVGNAVERNRARRLMRESYRLLYDDIKKGIDIIIVARKLCASSKMPVIKAELFRTLKKLGLIENEKSNINNH